MKNNCTKVFMFLIFCSLFLLNQSQAQQKEAGAISDKILKEVQSSLKLDDQTKGLINAVSNNDIKKLALNRETVGKTNHLFAHRIKVKGITNQKSSGRCWLFTSLNVLRPKVVEKYNLKEFQFSENYSFFWDQFEKANLFLEGIIETRKKDIDDRDVSWLFKHPMQDGGIWNYAVDLIHKYGVVPKSAMSETHNSENTGMMRRLLRRKLREQGMQLRKLHENGNKIKNLRKQKVIMLSEIYRMLVISLGVPPSEFTWIYEDNDDKISEAKTYTPTSFFKEVVNVNLYDYVQLMDDPSKPYNKLYQISYDRNLYDKDNWTFINLPVAQLKIFAKNSILNNEAMYFSCDVGKQLNSDAGILHPDNYDYGALFGVKFGMNKTERVLTYDSGSSHGMSLIGVDTTADGETTKWLLENSWGSSRGYKGFLTMTDEWFSEYMFRLVIHKKYISQDVLEILKQKPEKLPPWDRMF